MNGLGVDAQGLTQLARDVNKIKDRDLRNRFREGLKDAAEVVAVDARGRASWSTRIPGSIRVGVTTRGAYVRAGGTGAPHAVTFEGKSNGDARKHPVYAKGPRSGWTWVPQEPRPFLRPALVARQDQVVDIVADKLLVAFTDNNWH